jgi:hypothetical protein
MPKPSNVVPLNTRQNRIDRQIDKVLDDLEELPIPPKERVAALYTIMRIQVAHAALRKAQGDGAGSTVRRYAKAFQTDATRGRKGVARSVATTLDLESDDDDDLSA